MGRLRYVLISENGNTLEEGDSLDSRNYMLWLCRNRFRRTMVSVIDRYTMEEMYYDRDGNYRCIDWKYASRV